MPAPDDQQITRLIEILRKTIHPAAVLTTGAEYDEARRIWNGAVSTRPAVILRCVEKADIRAAVRAAQMTATPLTVRGGGHDWAGRALSEGGLTIDVSRLRRVEVDAAARVADVQAGATSADIAAAAAPFGLVPVTGTAGSVGMAGLTLGGGYGPLSGRFGLALDNLLSADVVLADGSIVTTDAEHEPDLFWALRGGGGNFGVVTSMRVRLHTVPTLLTGVMVFPWAQADTILTRLSDLLSEDHDELTVQYGVLAGPEGAPGVFVSPTWSGDSAQSGERALDRLRALGTPLVSQVGPGALPQMLAGIDAQFPAGRHIEIRTRSVPTLSESVRETLIHAGSTLTSPYSAVSVHTLQGAAARVPVAQTAFGLRDPHLMIEIIAGWEPSDSGAREHRAWADDVARAFDADSLPGGYPNLLGPGETERIAHAYGPNARRLRAAKRRYDPQNVFHAIPLPAERE